MQADRNAAVQQQFRASVDSLAKELEVALSLACETIARAIAEKERGNKQLNIINSQIIFIYKDYVNLFSLLYNYH